MFHMCCRLECFSCHIQLLTKCPNWCRTWNICFLLIFSWKVLQPNFAFWDIFMLLKCLNSKEIKLQSSIRVICIIFNLIFFQLKIKNITNIPSSTTISTLCQVSNMTRKAHWSWNVINTKSADVSLKSIIILKEPRTHKSVLKMNFIMTYLEKS